MKICGMSFAAALLLSAQALASQDTASTPPDSSDTTRRRVAVAAVEARVRVLRPARIDFDTSRGEVAPTSSMPPQRGRDARGTVWIEFS